MQTAVKNKAREDESFLNLKSLNSSLTNKILKTHKEGMSRNGAIPAKKKRSNNSINADKDRNLRSSNTNRTSDVNV